MPLPSPSVTGGAPRRFRTGRKNIRFARSLYPSRVVELDDGSGSASLDFTLYGDGVPSVV